MRLRGAVLVAMVAAAATLFAVPPASAADDPLIRTQWGLDQVRAREAWARSRGAGAVIAVVDSGVDLGHPDLAGRLVAGYDFVANTSSPQDQNGHGTHVAAVAGAADNGYGVSGVAPEAAIMPIRVLNSDAVGTARTIARGVDFAVDRGAHVINLSMAGSNVVSTGLEVLRTAVARANSRGVVVVAAAGNEASSTNPNPICGDPASFAGVVCVAATDRREARAAYSNVAAKNDGLAVTAPGGSGARTCGENIVSAVRVGTGLNASRCGYGLDHDEQVGTSQASGFVSGVAALLVAQGKGRDEVIRAITTTARQPLTGQRGVSTHPFGYGIVDAAAAVGMPFTSGRSGSGYWLVAADGGIFSFGTARFLGSTGAVRLNRPIVGMAPTPDGNGYWLVASDGGIFAFGNASFFGSTGALRLNSPVVAMASAPDGRGYWLVAADGGIFAFGTARFAGSTGALRLNSPIVGMAPASDGNGYWLVASDGGIFAFGTARYAGSAGGARLNRPIVGMAPTPAGNGYWLVASDGGIFAFGDARYLGSTGALRLNLPVVAMAATPDANGYWLAASDGGIFAFGNAGFFGSTGALALNAPVVGMAGN